MANGVKLIEFAQYTDGRGTLTPIERKNDIPFEIKRVFYIYNLHPDSKRGEHAHRLCQQVIIPVSGGLIVQTKQRKWVLTSTNIGLFVPAGVYVTLRDFAPGTVVLVLCSELYDPLDYVIDPEDLLL